MVAKSIVKLIDEAIIPAVTIILGKLIGLYLASYFFKLNFEIVPSSFLKVLPAVHFNDPQSYILAENYSNLAMLFAASIGTIFVTFRAHFLHSSHIPPALHQKLIRLNLESLIAPTYSLYHQAATWLTYLWLVTAFITVSSILGITFPQISIIAFIIAANFSWIFALDIQREIEINRTRNNEA